MLELLGGGPRANEGRLGMDSGTIAPNLNRCEGSKLIAKRRDAHDERRVMVELAPGRHAFRDGI